MATSIYVAALKYACPRCKAEPSKSCRTPKGRPAYPPHGERVSLCTEEDWEASKIKKWSPLESCGL